MADDPVSARHEPIPDSTDLLGEEHGRRRRRLFAILGVGTVVVVGGAIAAVVVQDRAAKAALSSSSADLSMCLFGQAVPPSEPPARRLRAGQLAAMGLSEVERSTDGQAWPQRCGVIAQDLMESAKSAGLASKDDDTDLVDRADALAKALKAPAAQFADLSSAVDGTWAAMAKAGLAVEASKKVAGPPAVAKPLELASLGEAAALSTTSFAFSSIQMSPYSGDVIHLLVQDAGVPRSPFVCTVDGGPIRCRPLPGELGKGQKRLVLVGTAATGAWPLLMAGKDGDQGLWRSDTGVKIADVAPLGASIAADGTVRTLRQDGERLVEEQLAADGSKGRVTRHHLPRGCDSIAAGLLGDQGVVECRISSRAKQRANEWVLLPLGEDALGPGDEKPREDEEEAEPEAAPVVRPSGLRTCRAGDTLVTTFNRTIHFFDGLAWTQPQKPNVRQRAITCGDKVASTTFLAEAGGESPWRTEIGHVRCTVAECAQTNVEFERLLRGGLEGAPRAKLFDAASIGDQMLVAWAAGELGGVRVRVGAPDAVVAAKDVVVVDDVATEGELARKPDLLELVVLGQPKHATLLLRSSRGVHAVRVQPDGGFAPAQVVWEGGK